LHAPSRMAPLPAREFHSHRRVVHVSPSRSLFLTIPIPFFSSRHPLHVVVFKEFFWDIRNLNIFYYISRRLTLFGCSDFFASMGEIVNGY
jgi:hypothetical protein